MIVGHMKGKLMRNHEKTIFNSSLGRSFMVEQNNEFVLRLHFGLEFPWKCTIFIT